MSVCSFQVSRHSPLARTSNIGSKQNKGICTAPLALNRFYIYNMMRLPNYHRVVRCVLHLFRQANAFHPHKTNAPNRTICGIDTIPQEILEEIFQFYLQSVPPDLFMDGIAFTQDLSGYWNPWSKAVELGTVYRHWRLFTVFTSALWTYQRIPKGCSPDHIEKMSARSGNRPLTVGMGPSLQPSKEETGIDILLAASRETYLD